MKLNSQRHSTIRFCQRAFSLIEMMVAVSLLLVIVLGLFAMFNQAQRALKQGTTQVDIMEPGRATMDILARDFQELTACKVTNTVNFQTVNTAFTNPLRQPLPGSATRTNELDEVFFLSRYNDQWSGVGYRVDNTNDGVGTLYRFLATRSFSGVTNLPSSFFKTPIHPKVDLVNTNFHRVLDGLVHFKVIPYRSTGELFFPRDFDVVNDRQNIRVSKDGNFYTFLNERLPAYVEVELGVLEPAIYEQFKVQPAALKRKFLESKAAQVHLFRQRIPIRTAQ